MKYAIQYNRTFFTVLVTAVLLYGCTKKLDQVPETAITDANFWKTTNDLKLACNYFYTFLPAINSTNGVFADNYSIDGYATSPNNVSDGSRLAPASDGNWSNNYALIRACNNMLEKSVTVPGVAAEIKALQGEARFFRAWAYYNLVIRYGDVPLVTRTFGLEDTLINTKRAARETVIDTIYADLDWAATNLYQIDVQPAADYGRITQTAALALKARMALFEGTRQKFHAYGTPSKHLQVAINTCNTIINGGKHALYKHNKIGGPDSSYYYNFQNSGEGKTNKENMLVRLYGADVANRISTHVLVRNLEQGGLTPTRYLCDAYLYKDGLPYTVSPFDSTTASKQIRSLSQFSNRDLRMSQTVFNRNSWFIAGLYGLTYNFAPTGYRQMKYFIAADWNPNVSFIDYQIIRYAEVLLTLAEATYELNGTISDADLDKTINLTRARGGLPKLTNAFAVTNGLNMREEIRRERRVEFAFEGLRYWDLLRWKTAETELPQNVVGTKHFQAEYGNLPGNTTLTSDGFVIVQKVANRKFDPARDYLWPIPTQQLALQPALTQNKNWY